MAGFRNVIPPLGIYSGAVVPPDGGFTTPIPGLRLGGGATTLPPEGGFGTPLGVLLVRSASGIKQAGFYNVLPAIRLAATETEPEETGAGAGGGWPNLRFRPDKFKSQLVEDEIEDTLDAVIEDMEGLQERGLIAEASPSAIRELTLRRLRLDNEFIRGLRKTQQLSERVAILKLEARLNDLLRRRNRRIDDDDGKQAAAAAQEALDIEALLVIIGTVL